MNAYQLNQDQVLSIVRSVLQIIGTLAVSWGVFNSTDWATIAGGVVAVAPIVWGVWTHSQQQKLAQVAAMPEVKQIVVTTPKLAVDTPSDKVVSH